jgi:hypothetical protein
LLTEKLRREHKASQLRALRDNNEDEYDRLEETYTFLKNAKDSLAQTLLLDHYAVSF